MGLLSRPVVARVFQTAAEYFRAFSIRRLGGGGEFEVYGAPHVVIKRLSIDKIKVRNMLRHALTDRSAGPSDLVSEGRRVSSAVFEQKFGQLERMKDRLGGYVVPFELPDELSCRLHRLWGLWREGEKFYRPVVQHRIPRQAFLPYHLSRLRRTGDFAGIEAILEQAFQTMFGLSRRGFFPHDNLPDNFCLWEGGVRLFDVGAVWGSRSRVRQALSSEGRDEYVSRNLSQWIDAVRGNVSKGESPPLDRIATQFERQFDRFNRPRAVQGLGATGRNRVNRVPDVFPLTVCSA